VRINKDNFHKKSLQNKKLNEKNKRKLKSERNDTSDKFEEGRKVTNSGGAREELSRREKIIVREKSKRAVKKFNSGSLLFIGARGVVPRNPPRLDRYRVSGRRVYTPTFRG
jgi:hypothetical protein